jgi:hypothetical protein
MYVEYYLNIRIEKVPPLVIEIVKDLHGCLLVTCSHDILPGITEVHGPKTYRTDLDCSIRSKLAVITKETRRFWSRARQIGRRHVEKFRVGECLDGVAS